MPIRYCTRVRLLACAVVASRQGANLGNVSPILAGALRHLWAVWAYSEQQGGQR